jgi:hypothetical protein
VDFKISTFRFVKCFSFSARKSLRYLNFLILKLIQIISYTYPSSARLVAAPLLRALMTGQQQDDAFDCGDAILMPSIHAQNSIDASATHRRISHPIYLILHRFPALDA